MPRPCHATLNHTLHDAPLPLSDSAVSFVKVRVVAGNIRTASPRVERIGMLLTTIFVEFRVVAGRSRTLAGLWTSDANSHMPCHAMLMPLCRDLEKLLSERHGRGMACVDQTRPHCVNLTGKTQSKPSAARHGMGAAWERRGMCELALKSTTRTNCHIYTL
jgi:hypothetical protein